MDFKILSGKHESVNLDDTQEFLKLLQERSHCELFDPKIDETKKVFDWSSPLYLARAPGRLDVMGGIADYSGALVLQMPLKEACHCAVQLRNCQQEDFPLISIYSFCDENDNRRPFFQAKMSELFPNGEPMSYKDANAYFKRCGPTSWAAYMAGCLVVLSQELGPAVASAGRFAADRTSVSFVAKSSVPEGKGVSSSASLEVATMSALAAALGVSLSPEQLATLSQLTENFVVGAPCGIMDQMASALGRPERLLALLCRPAHVLGHVTLPDGVSFYGIDSGVRHSVGGSDYETVRAAAFMGRHMIKTWAARGMCAEEALGDPRSDDRSSGSHGGSNGDFDGGITNSNDGSGGSTECSSHPAEQHAAMQHLTELRPSNLAAYLDRIPTSMSGAMFLKSFGKDHGDKATNVLPDKEYPIRAAVRHAVDEHSRIETFKELLELRGGQQSLLRQNRDLQQQLLEAGHPPATDNGQHDHCENGKGDAASSSPAFLPVLGELMRQSHMSYSACGLGSDATDRIVSLVEQLDTAPDGTRRLFGSKISGGGNGGTVVVLGDGSEAARAAVQRVIEQYNRSAATRDAKGGGCVLFEGTSMGAVEFGVLVASFGARSSGECKAYEEEKNGVSNGNASPPAPKED